MDPKLDHLVSCILALEFNRRLTPEISGRALGALCAQPQSHLMGAFQDCLLLFNDRFVNTWSVDEEYLKQLERIIRPWFTYWSQSHGYRLFPGNTVEEIKSRYSLGTSAHLPIYISVLLELEYLTCNPEDAVENYLFELFEALESQLGQSLFNTVFGERFSKLSNRVSLCGNGAEGASKTQTQSKDCAHLHSASKDTVLDRTSSIPPSLDERYAANAPPQPSSRDQHNTAKGHTSCNIPNQSLECADTQDRLVSPSNRAGLDTL